MHTSIEKICHILQLFFDKSEKTRQMDGKIVNSVYGPDIRVNQEQIWLRRFRRSEN